jgi:hypothetical protein
VRRGRGKDIIALILSILSMYISLVKFFVIDDLGSRVFAVVFFIFFIYLFIVSGRDLIKKGNKK